MASDASTKDEQQQQQLEEEYIDIDISSTTFLCYTISSPPPSRDFEFHLSSNPLGKEEDSTTSPADELFYKGKLLPLHLPPRLQMVEKLLTNYPTTTTTSYLEEGSTNANATSKSIYSTPLESCNISPSSSCYVSGELNPAEESHPYYSAGVVQDNKKKSWSKKLKESSLGLKLKASRAYIKSLFTKSRCSYESCDTPKAKYRSTRSEKRYPFLQFRKESCCTDMKRKVEEDSVHRRSFSSVLGLQQSNKNASSTSSSCSSSTSSSFSSSGSDEQHCGGPAVLKRSSSVRSEVENPIQGAIAYCKKTQQLITARKGPLSDVGYRPDAIAVARDDKDSPNLCRG